MRKRTNLIRPTKEEDIEINRGIALDPDTYELADEDFKRMRPASKVVPEIVTAFKEGRLKVRGPQKTPTKLQITLRLSRDVVDFFKSAGRGWQTAMDKALREYVRGHR